MERIPIKPIQPTGIGAEVLKALHLQPNSIYVLWGANQQKVNSKESVIALVLGHHTPAVGEKGQDNYQEENDNLYQTGEPVTVPFSREKLQALLFPEQHADRAKELKEELKNAILPSAEIDL